MEIGSTLLSLVIWLSAPAAAALSARLLEYSLSFQSLSPNGKLVVAALVAALLGIVSVAGQQLLAQYPVISTVVDPYARVLIPIFAILAQQLTHGHANAGRNAFDGKG